MANVFTKNLSPANNVTIIYDLKVALLASGWTCTYSSDGLSAFGAGDNVTSSNSGANGLNNSNAYFILQQPGGGSAPYSGSRQLLFQFTNSQNWAIKYSFGGLFGTGTNTTAPTASDSGIVLGFGNASQLFALSDGQTRAQIMVDTTNFGFYLIGWKTGGGQTSCVFMFDPLLSASLDPSDVDPFLIYGEGSSNVLSSMGVGSSYGYSSDNFGAQGTVRGWLNKSLGSASFCSVPANSLCYLNGSNAVIDFPGCGSNAYTGADEAAPVVYARCVTSGGTTGFKGISGYAKWNGTTRSNGDTLTLSTSKDRIYFGQCSLPWDGSTPTV